MLKEYNNKRNFNKTNEPKGIKSKSNKRKKFCIQHHLAKKDHYDFRLEYKGELLSWAIPKGPSYNPKDKRLAVHTENHPLSYLDYEGIIPKGQYGAGTVMLWDIGYYKEKESFNKTYLKGYLKFILYGKRCQGAFTLIKYKDNNWLLIKEKDNIKSFNNINKYNTSIKSNLTMNDIKNNNIIKLTNPNKIIYPKDKILKKDIYAYYKKVYKYMVPYLNNRLISTVRCPNGINNKFYKKHFKENKYLKLYKNNKKEEYYYIDNIEGLLYEVQLNSIEFHIGNANINNINYPDYMVFDLDPDEKLSINKIREGVKDLKNILDKLNLKSYLKTSGGKGYHVVVPFNIKMNNKKFSNFAKNIALLMEQKYPSKYTSNMNKSKRNNKIYIDWMRNSKGSTSVCPYSLRVRDKCSVSMPIKWSELDKVKPNDIDINEALKRLKRKNPWKDFWD